jgi:formylglycine-generating enzyme required for sulfatase activity
VRFHQFIAAAGLALACVFAPAHAEKRVALVVGNGHYVNLAANEQPEKAVNNARAIGAALQQLGFEVIAGENLGRQALLARLDEAAQRLAPGDMAVFFFSGHGVALDGANYILPADVPAVGRGQNARLAAAAVREEDIGVRLMRAGARAAVVVLDACRDNPFGPKGPGLPRGLAAPPEVPGVFTLYAAARGYTALDRLSDGDPDPHSVFTRVLAPMLSRPGLDLRDLAYEVRAEVARRARNADYNQRPEDFDATVGGRFHLGPAPLTADQERALKRGDTFRECLDCPEMIVVPAGGFTMGSPRVEDGDSLDGRSSELPQHVVWFTHPFAAGKLHVTVDQYAAFAHETRYEKSRPCNWSDPAPGFKQDGSHPVVCVDWEDAHAYVAWLAAKTHGKPYRLLSEAEWEYAARGRTEPGAYTRFSFGDDPKELCKYGHFNDDSVSCDHGYANTAPAGRYQPNNFGLYDMFGNAYQWTEDCWHSDYNPAKDGSTAPMDGSAWTTTTGCETGPRVWTGTRWEYVISHVIRGGFYGGRPENLRAAARGAFAAESSVIGFRVARTLAQ